MLLTCFPTYSTENQEDSVLLLRDVAYLHEIALLQLLRSVSRQAHESEWMQRTGPSMG